MLVYFYFVNIVFFLCFFPYFKLIPNITAEVQPFCGFVALFLIFLRKRKLDPISQKILYIIALLFFYLLISFYRGLGFSALILSIISYTLPLFILLVFKDDISYVAEKTFLGVVLINFFIGIIQLLGGFGFLNNILALIISRGTGSSSLDGLRGITLLTPEPSHAGRTLGLILCTAFFLHALRRISKIKLGAIILALIILLIANKSGTGFILFSIFLCSYSLSQFILKQDKKFNLKSKFSTAFLFKIIISMLLGVLVMLTLWFSIDALYIRFPIRFLQILLRIKNSFNNFYNFNLYHFLALVAGKRYLTVAIGYFSLFQNYGLGHGLSSYLIDFTKLSQFAGVDFQSITTLPLFERTATALKPDSYGASIAQDTGIVGLILLLTLLISVWKSVRLPNVMDLPPSYLRHTQSVCVAIFAVALYMILLNTSTSLPFPWLLLSYVYCLRQILTSGQIKAVRTGSSVPAFN